MRAAVGTGLRRAAHAGRDAFGFVARLPGAIGRGVRSFWLGLSVASRRRLGLAALGAALAAAVLAFAVPRLPCRFPGGDLCAPQDDSELIVPADALAYVHLTLDPETQQYQEAADTLDVLPQISRQVTGRLLAQVPGPGGEAADFARDIAPWLGGQAAVAIVPGAGAAEQVQLLEEGDPQAAGEFAESLAAGTARSEDYRGVEIAVDSRGLATSSVGGFLVIGTEAGVRRVVDVETGAEGTRPLASDPVAEELRDELPPERFAEAFVSRDGIEDLVASESSPLASLEPFVDAATSQGFAVSVGAADGSLELAIRSSLDPQRSRNDPGFFAAFPAFEPRLPERLASNALAYVGVGDPGSTISELLAQATAEAPALAAGLSAAADRLRDAGDVQVEDELLPALGGEAAFALQPGQGGSDRPAPEGGTTVSPALPEGLPQGPAPTLGGETPVPILQFLADGVDAERARQALARLQGSIAEALDPGTSLQAPVFDRLELAGIQLEVLRISPTVNLTYALAGDSLAIATQPEGVEQVVRGDGGLSETDSYEDALAGFADEPSLLAYLNLTGLVELAEREGLAEDPAYALLAPEIRRLQAAGIAIEAGPEGLETDLRVLIRQDGGDAGRGGEEPPSD